VLEVGKWERSKSGERDKGEKKEEGLRVEKG
jgi:hypothetical protein